MIEVRNVLTQVETIYHEFGPQGPRPLIRGAVAAVLKNPYAGRYEPDILPMMEHLNEVGLEMAHKLLAAMQVQADDIESYGKGSIVGGAGELEHGALWHVPGGYAMRELLGWKGDRNSYKQGQGSAQKGLEMGRALSIVPSTKKVGAPGTKLDVPLTHVTASYVRGHFDAIEVYVPGAPAADELVFILAMTTGARIHERVGGLKPEQISKFDGLR
ncbi:amino acid synthesis family protein [Eoetvoesiella caeni]|uniref:amino acid synthesis family protein n=1 Tax=Eoetvoesiella caeni TaxID=645616 RepID=UPI000DE8907F|nr:amino acid synthesis family protein [Eoetvoesiella caeni]MCI2808233.1 amino acid synthesis family protein [Eoetvoesiella caeni]NYT53764.1 amino acid synthesis family protein [Eoetvoesiella caeni]